MDIIAKEQTKTSTKVYYCLIKEININDCTVVLNNKEYTLPFYGGVPIPNNVYPVVLPQNNINQAFVIGETEATYITNANITPHLTRQLSFYRYDSNTLNTPYKQGITSFATGIIICYEGANGCSQLAIAPGSIYLFFRRGYNGNYNSWGRFYDTNYPPSASDVGAVAKSGDIMTGNLEFNSSNYALKNFPVSMTSGNNYWLFRGKDSDENFRGGLSFYRDSNNGDGLWIRHYRNGITNGLNLYIDNNNNAKVVVGYPAAWCDALGVTADYKAGDTISFPSSGNSYFTRFHGDWRYTTTLYFFIPTSRSCAGLSATVSGTIYLVTNGVRNSVNMSDVTPTCFCNESGIAVRLLWATAPSYAVQFNLASVQPYGFTVTFS